MNLTKRSPTPSIFQSLVEVLGQAQSVDRSHLLIAALFLSVLRAKTAYLPIFVPAFVLGSYHEWWLQKVDGISTCRYSLSAILLCWLGTFLFRLAKRRIKIHNLPGVPHSLLFGHIPTLAKETPKLPLDAHTQVLMNHLADEYDLRKIGLWYTDAYPFQNDPVLVVASPEVAVQVTQITSFPKHETLIKDFGPVIGRRGMVGQEGSDWKQLRQMFNPGFSQANLLSMVPMIADETEVFASRLSKLAAGDGFVTAIESLCAELTVDIIGQVVFGLEFHSQTRENPMVHSIIEASKLVGVLSDISPQRLNVWKTLKLKYYEWLSDSQLMKMLRIRWSELAASPENAVRSNAIFDIAMATYMKRGGKVDINVTKDFLELMRDNVKTFIFAGHDTTSSVLAYSFYELFRHPEILEEVRAEHESVLGPDPNKAAERLKEDPKLANALPLTTAVVREVMRMHLPATSARIGPPGSTVTGKDGKSYPAEGFMVWVNNNIIMHDPLIFPSPYEFIPNRFLPNKSPFPPIPKNAYRPFSNGPRDCIGQELAYLESRAVLALILRKFNFKEGYEELDRRLGRKGKVYELSEKIGGRAYQILWTTAKPKDGLPMWVEERA